MARTKVIEFVVIKLGYLVVSTLQCIFRGLGVQHNSVHRELAHDLLTSLILDHPIRERVGHIFIFPVGAHEHTCRVQHLGIIICGQILAWYVSFREGP